MKNNNPEINFNDKANDKKYLKRYNCSEFILRTLREANQALCYTDFGNRYKYGTLRNEIKKLVDSEKILKLPKECPARFILAEWASRPEYYYVQRNDKKSRVGRFDFLSYLKSLSWEPILGIHDVKLCFLVYQLRWVPNTWKYCKKSQSYCCSFLLSYPVSVQCFDTGTVMVSIKSSLKPFPLDVDGLLALAHLLGEVRAILHAPCVPNPSSWRVVQWHLNRDSEKLQGGGVDMYLTFRDFFFDSAQFYYKSKLDKVRSEVSQNPKSSIKDLFENILNRDNNQKKGDF